MSVDDCIQSGDFEGAVALLSAQTAGPQADPGLLLTTFNYLGTGRAAEPRVRTGGETMWAREHGYAQAMGQRDFKATMEGGGASMIGILQVKRIDFENQARPAPAPEKKGFWKSLFG